MEEKNRFVLEYVVSGMGFTRLLSNNLTKDNINLAKKWLDMLNDDHKFSVLYNAHTEKSFGKIFNERYSGSVNSVYADSGGLQVVTQGLSITEPLKMDVYKNQAAHSDLGMCFDEIPLEFSGSRSGRLDLSNRWFNKKDFRAMAEKTGDNLNNQINTFLEEKSNCRPVFIIQGNCYDTYMKWVEYAMSKVSIDNRKFVTSVAMGAASLGHGTLEDIRRAFYYSQLPIDGLNHTHLLAVGSQKRLLPNIIFAQSGLYDSGTRISYDSTTHSSGTQMGRYVCGNGNNHKYTRTFSKKYQLMHSELTKLLPEYSYSLEEYHKLGNMDLKKGHALLNDNGNGVILTNIADFVLMVKNFKDSVDNITEDFSYCRKYLKEREYLPLLHLQNVKTKDDYLKWESFFSRRVSSHPVNSNKPTALF